MTKLLLPIALGLAIVGCGDNLKAPSDASVHDATMPPDAGIPAAPTLGAQIDRMGRPAINTALNHVLDPDMNAKGAAKDAYNQDEDVANWPMTYALAFAQSLALLDGLDPTAIKTGCGNQPLYNATHPMDPLTPVADSYVTLAGVLANDQLFLDTTKKQCTTYLAVEFDVVAGAGHADCGGRAPVNDVIDASYSALVSGVAGFSGTPLMPNIRDGVSAHTDITDTFPFLGTPH